MYITYIITMVSAILSRVECTEVGGYRCIWMEKGWVQAKASFKWGWGVRRRSLGLMEVFGAPGTVLFASL